MNDTDTTHQHGRRARRLDPAEAAAAESLTAAEITGELDAVPSARGAVAAPGADEPVPKLRKFGRRARIIELIDDVPPHEAAAAAAAAAGASAPVDATVAAADADQTAQADALTHDSMAADVPEADSAEDVIEPAPDVAEAADADARAREAIVRDRDGVELGELSVADAPHPKPAPRFDGKVLHRPERSGGRPLVWIVWALIAIALVVLIALLLAGVIGPGTEGAAAHALSAGPLNGLLEHPTHLIDLPI